MSLNGKRWTVAAAALAVLAVVGLAVGFTVLRPKPPPPAPPAPPPKWECGTAYGNEICERTLPPVRPAP